MAAPVSSFLPNGMNVGPATPPSVEQSARATIEATLTSFGLQSLAGVVWDWYMAGKPIESIMLDMRQTTEYKTRFPGMAALAAKGMSMSEAEYINYERTAAGLFRAYGLPPGFYDGPEDFGNFIANNVSVSEVEERLKLASAAVYQAPPETRAELQRLYGIDTGKLTAFWLDPQKAFPLLQQQYAAAQIAGTADISGYGALTRTEAETLAGRGLTTDAMYKGFGQLAQSKELFHGIPGQSGARDFSKEEQFGAAFGFDPGSAIAIEQEAARRKAQFAGGGQYATGKEGIAGLGTASS